MPSKYVSAARMRKSARAVHEGAPASLELLAELSGRTEKYWAGVAKQEGWRTPEDPPFSDREPLQRRLRALSDRLVKDLEVASREGQAAGSYDKSRLDALSSMLRMVEKIGEMARVPARAAEEQKRSDAELAAALALIDARIVELACELAASMGGGETDRAGTGVPAPR